MLLPLALLLLLSAPARADEPCKGVVLPVEARALPASLVSLADATLRREAARSGCTLVEGAVVADMRRMLRLPPRPAAANLVRLAQSLLAGWVLSASLASGPDGRVVVNVSGYTAGGAQVSLGSTVPVARMLPDLARLATEVTAALRPAPASQPPSSQPAASQPVAASQPASQPVAARPAPPPPRPATTMRPPRTVPAPPTTVARRPGRQLQLWLGAGIRGYSLRSWDRGGPLTELEVGAVGPQYRMALLFRSYFGDRTAYYLGGRAEAGPRWGWLRLSFGADLGLIFIPDTVDALDMMVLNLHPASVLVHLGPVVLQLDALSIDLYVIPANTEVGREVDGLYGFSSGVTVGVAL